MKKLTCEMCGSTDLIKQDGVFECQTCGCKYSVEEAKKMMVEGVVKVEGTVKVDNSAKIKKWMTNGESMYRSERYKDAQKLYQKVLNEDPENAEAMLYERLSFGWQIDFSDYNVAKSNYGNGLSVMYYARSAAIEVLNAAYNKEEGITRELDEYEEDFFIIDTVGGLEKLAYEIARQCKKIESSKDRVDAESIVANAFDEVLSLISSVIDNKWVNAACLSSDFTCWKTTAQEAKKMSVGKDEWKWKWTSKSADELITKLDECFRQRLEEEWQKYPDEKNFLEQHKSTLEKERCELEKAYDEYKRKMEELEKEEKELLPAEVERNSLIKERDELILAKNALGFFKRKEKLEIDAKTTKIGNRIDELDHMIRTQKHERKKEVDNEISVLEKQIVSSNGRIKMIEGFISKINEALGESPSFGDVDRLIKKIKGAFG